MDNFLYEVEHYGFILNANRTYFLTRSQPPFLTRMILALPPSTYDRAWLERATEAAETYHAFWAPEGARVPLRHVVSTGLARYWDAGKGPAPAAADPHRSARPKPLRFPQPHPADGRTR